MATIAGVAAAIASYPERRATSSIRSTSLCRSVRWLGATTRSALRPPVTAAPSARSGRSISATVSAVPRSALTRAGRTRIAAGRRCRAACLSIAPTAIVPPVAAALESIRRVADEPEATRRTADARRSKIRALEQYIGGVGADLGIGAAHDAGERDRSSTVGNDQIVREELARDAVERDERLAATSASDDDPPVGDPRQVERVERLPPLQHDVVRHVDDVADRPHADHREADLHPRGRRRDTHAANDACRVPWTEVRRVDVDAHGGCSRRILLAKRRRRDVQLRAG